MLYRLSYLSSKDLRIIIGRLIQIRYTFDSQIRLRGYQSWLGHPRDRGIGKNGKNGL